MRYLTLALALCMTATAAAQTGPALMAMPFKDGRTVEAQTDAAFFGDTDVDSSDGGGDFDLNIYDGSARWAVTGEDNHDIRVGYQITYLELDTDNALFAGIERLADQSVAVGFNVGQWRDWDIDASVGVGHAGNSPYTDDDAVYYMADIIATKKLDETSSLVLLLNYDGNRAIWPDTPLPGIAFQHEISDTFSYVAGLPYSQIVWKPADRWTLTLDYFVPTTINARADYALTDAVTLFGAYENRLDAFHIDGADEHRRVLFSQSRAEAGVRWDVCANATVEVAGGIAFDQEFTGGYDVRNDNDIAEIDSAGYVKVGIEMGF